jgi:toxin ParE1/3/4
MADYELSTLAASDIENIYEYTIGHFALDQARSYLTGLFEMCRVLAQTPKMGRAAQDLAPNLRRFEYRSHIVFNTPKDEGVFIDRVLHERMDIDGRIEAGK